MTAEAKICQNCKTSFTVEPEDFKFYEKIKVPPPTFCPECRLQRRLIWRNQWHFYKKNDAFGRPIFSLFPPEARVKIYERDYWWSDNWDPMQYGKECDFSRPFFTQFKELMETVPLPARSVNDMVNSGYSNNAGYCKNCYLVFDANYCEDSGYLVDATYSKHCYDCLSINKCELCYDGFNLDRCYRVLYSMGCESSHDCYFARDCIGCSFCFGCTNLRNKSYYIFNKSYPKDEYMEKLKELTTAPMIEKYRQEMPQMWQKYPRKFTSGRHNANSTGDYIFYSKNTQKSYRVVRGEDLKYCYMLQEGPNKDCMDYSIWGHNTELIYETSVCGQSINNIKFSWLCYGEAKNLEYCISCHGSSDLFGCVGLRNKQYCILNKQYSKDEYVVLRKKIVAYMAEMPYVAKNGTSYKYGEFFPADLSPFVYNDTLAQEYFPLTKETAIGAGYFWRDPDQKDYAVTLDPKDLPQVESVTGEVLKQTIGCEHGGICNDMCTRAFVITPEELSFYKSLHIPLPRLCPNCREWRRIRIRNSFKLFKRMCECSGTRAVRGDYENTAAHFHGQKECPNEFETSYTPQHPDIVYCEQCYQAEVV